MTFNDRILLSIAALSVSSVLPAQQVPTHHLTPAAEFPEPFSAVSGVRELIGGELILVDGSDHRIWRINFARRERRPLGQQGTGPFDYLSPVTLAAVGRQSVIGDY